MRKNWVELEPRHLNKLDKPHLRYALGSDTLDKRLNAAVYGWQRHQAGQKECRILLSSGKIH